MNIDTYRADVDRDREAERQLIGRTAPGGSSATASADPFREWQGAHPSLAQHETVLLVNGNRAGARCKKCGEILAVDVSEPEAHRSGMAHYREHYA